MMPGMNFCFLSAAFTFSAVDSSLGYRGQSYVIANFPSYYI